MVDEVVEVGVVDNGSTMALSLLSVALLRMYISDLPINEEVVVVTVIDVGIEVISFIDLVAIEAVKVLQIV